MSSIASQFAQQLLEVQCIKLQPTQPFTWASGWLSPFYCDNRKTLAYPKVRTFVKDQLAAMIRAQYPEATAIAGVATGAIAQGALVADALNLPMCYVRAKAKDHGMGNLIEGTLPEGAKSGGCRRLNFDRWLAVLRLLRRSVPLVLKFSAWWRASPTDSLWLKRLSALQMSP